jgi:hypothetical protein
MKLRLAGTVKKLNIEHWTFDVRRSSVSFSIKLAASAASGWADTRHLKPDVTKVIFDSPAISTPRPQWCVWPAIRAPGICFRRCRIPRSVSDPHTAAVPPIFYRPVE